ncbi:unnamed protein product [Pieris macdunnoughi]|uniref:Microsomal glutathione S-transferase 1 n=1 Tax=Pieris macdunnoughi TaxID=345717 RepID=A0A821U5C2_9NEOP|nr:unnamed protein product [Pieris macdunnoughi]
MNLSISDPAVQAFILHSAILAVKLLAMSPLTAIMRLTYKCFANPEDAKFLGGKVKLDHPSVERVRRAHLNDLENIPAFWVIGACYLTTGPSAAFANLLFRLFTVCRIVHTFVYAVVPFPQPTRAIVFLIAMGINFYMGLQVLLFYMI